ncbi:alpha/beta hydrolase [Planobispora rosea]|uniref:Alpha/beta hydrolase n=1 Tax=Planobispora rosea TaxID=35762 RepID=A0A8J3RXC9_PLARO|nr:alpha/beta hydrolase [Planobispora rosea]GGS64767.1 alpha/beta hydrolase [Planobispora rosea]GIH84821.1 alpha/beta hydrolase [Planobispora rosea]
MTTAFQTVTSADGTAIAFEAVGGGRPVILVGGAFNDRSTVSGLAAALAPDFTAIAYDRRGRGDSGDNSGASSGVSSDSSGGGIAGYAVEREVEDIAALIKHVGGSAAVFGHSSGAILAIEAARTGLPIDALAVYEPPYVVDDSRGRPGADLAERLQALIGQGRRDDAVELFLTEAVDVPAEAVAGMRNDQVWSWFTGLAHTLPYDVAICGPGNVLPADRLASITVPTLAIDGGLSPRWALAATRAVADAVPGARHLTLEGQDHGVLHRPDALRPVLLDFLA